MKRNQFPLFSLPLSIGIVLSLTKNKFCIIHVYNTRTGETSNAQRNIYASLSKAEVSSKTKEFSTGIKKKSYNFNTLPFPKIVHFLHRILAFIKIAARCTQRVLHVSGWEKRGGTALASQRKNGKGLLGKGNDSAALFIRRIPVIRPSRRELVGKKYFNR